MTLYTQAPTLELPCFRTSIWAKEQMSPTPTTCTVNMRRKSTMLAERERTEKRRMKGVMMGLSSSSSMYTWTHAVVHQSAHTRRYITHAQQALHPISQSSVHPSFLQINLYHSLAGKFHKKKTWGISVKVCQCSQGNFPYSSSLDKINRCKIYYARDVKKQQRIAQITF